MKHAFFTTLIIFFTFLTLSGQSTDQNVARPKSDRIPVAGSEKVDLIFSRTFMFANADSADIAQGRSGSTSFGIGYGIPLGRAVEIKFEPRITWQKLVFTETGDSSKFFPTAYAPDNYVFEKLRMAYVEVPVGFKFKGARNAEDKYKFLFEAGFSFGFNVSSTYKSRYEVDLDGNGSLDAKQTTKVSNVLDLNELRYGPFGRIGTNWISIYGFYRMTEIFDEEKQVTTPTRTRDYPKFPKLELGVSIRI